MATAIPNVYNFTNNGPRRQGQTRRTTYQSLHGGRLNVPQVQKEEVKEEDINAPPQDSSDEGEAASFQAEDYAAASDPDSEFDDVKTGKLRPSLRGNTSQAEKTSARCNEQRPSIDTFDGVNSHKNDLARSSHKRKSDHLSEGDDFVKFEMSQPKKAKRGSGYGKRKARIIHDNPSKGQEKKDVMRKVPSAEKRGTSGFVRPRTADDILGALDKQITNQSPNQSSPSSSRNSLGSKGPLFKAPPKLPSPPPKAAKVGPTFKRPAEPNLGENLVPARRPSLRKMKPLSPDWNKSNARSFNDSANLAAKKLGLPDESFKPPSSAPTVPSPIATSSASSGVSSPPTSFADDKVAAVRSNPMELEAEHPDPFPKGNPLSQSSQVPRCPMCKALVDSLLLEGFTGNGRMTIREQTRFCKAHKRRSAEEEWQAKGYPNIDWPFLHMQVKIHREAIDEILKGERFSFYRNAYDDYLKREKHRTLQQSLVQGGGIEDFSPGYYGSRGARIMIDNLMSNFASKLRRRSSTDGLISSRGVSNYVQAVLVPELATLLVMDDLKVDAERAREILRDSVELGNFLNEEEDEVIKDPEVEDNE